MGRVQAADHMPDDRTSLLVIRPVRPEEHSAVGELVVGAYRAGGHLQRDEGYGVHLADVAGRADEHPVLVAERDGVLVGTVTICPPGTSHSKDARDDEVEFRYLGVAAGCLGHRRRRRARGRVRRLGARGGGARPWCSAPSTGTSRPPGSTSGWASSARPSATASPRPASSSRSGAARSSRPPEVAASTYTEP